jgi:hypothetical protein
MCSVGMVGSGISSGSDSDIAIIPRGSEILLPTSPEITIIVFAILYKKNCTKVMLMKFNNNNVNSVV